MTSHDDADGETSLTGVWSGQYWYGAGEGRTSFAAYLIETGGGLEGTTLERILTLGGREMSATLIGVRSGTGVSFTKVYDQADEFGAAPISYSGTANADLTLIEGEWVIQDRGALAMRGGFRMRRVRGQKARARRVSQTETIH